MLSSLIVSVGSFSLATSVSRSDGQCVWQGRQDIHGKSSSTIGQAFCIVVHVSVTTATTLVQPIV
eukprot:3720142-Prymnesium_polylepis.1